MTMTAQELIDILTEYVDTHGEDTEVRLMTQEQWPFENSISGLCSSEELFDEKYDEDDDDAIAEREADAEEEADKPAVVYIVEGGQLSYGDKAAWAIARNC